MPLLGASAFSLRRQLLTLAEQHVPQVGFTNEALILAIDESGKRAEVNDALLAQMFQRGFPSALVENVVQRSNTGVQQLLEAKYNKNAIIDVIAKNEENFSLGRFALPTGQDVAQDALLAKIAYLQPIVKHWPDAVAIEYSPSNVPYTVMGLAEFVDTTAYYMERVENLGKLLMPARHILNARMMSPCIPTQDLQSTTSDGVRSASAEFLHSFVRGIPLSPGPHSGEASFSMTWYARRAKLAGVYATSMTSLMGDESKDGLETRNLAKSVIATIF